MLYLTNENYGSAVNYTLILYYPYHPYGDKVIYWRWLLVNGLFWTFSFLFQWL